MRLEKVSVEKQEEEEKKKELDVGKTWGALRKCWKGYNIAKVQNDEKRMILYASRIRKLQRELNDHYVAHDLRDKVIAIALFPNLGLESAKQKAKERTALNEASVDDVTTGNED